MQIILDANGVSTIAGDSNTAVVCSDVMRACGYVPTGVAREFNVFPSYRLVRLATKKSRIAVVDMPHAIEWLQHKHRLFRLKDNQDGKRVFAAFARMYLTGLAKESVDDKNGNTMIYRPVDISSAVGVPRSMSVDNSLDLGDCLMNILAEFENTKQHLCQFNAVLAEITERKAQYAKHIALFKNKLMELESLL